MVMQNTYSIGDLIKQRKTASDTITKTLQRETRPAIMDRFAAMGENIAASNAFSPVERKLTSPEEVFQGRVANKVAPQMSILKVVDDSIAAGSAEAKNINDAFTQFADNPEDLAKLWDAAHSDGEEINSSNATTYAARKARELGLVSVKKQQALNQAAFAANKANAISGKANGETVDNWRQIGTSDQSMPTDASLIKDSNGILLSPPPIEGAVQGDIGLPTSTSSTSEIESQHSQAGGNNLFDVNGVVVDLNKLPILKNSQNVYKDRQKAYEAVRMTQNRKDVISMMEAGRIAMDKMPILDAQESVIRDMISRGENTGTLQSYIGSLSNNPNFEFLDSSSAGLTMLNRVAGTGSVSDADLQELKKQVANSSKNPITNLALIAVTKAKLKNDSDFADFLDWYLQAAKTTSGASEAWKKFRNDNVMISIDENKMPVINSGYNANWRDYFGGISGKEKELTFNPATGDFE